MSDPQYSILLDEPKEVDVVVIEQELARLWKEASEPSIDEETPPVVRACSLNLIAVTENEADAEIISNLVGEVTVEHPSRIFIVVADRRAGTPSLEAWISARCSLPLPGGKQVCCEQINLTAHSNDIYKVPSIITSLLVSDVPTVLLWKLRVDEEDDVLPQLVHISDRVLIDSSEERDASASLSAWNQFIVNNRGQTVFGDLAWTHLTSWRGLLAQAFQPIEMREHLNATDAVTIRYSSSHRPLHSGLSQSLLMMGWLAHVLQWNAARPLQNDGAGKYTAKFSLGEKAIDINIYSVPPTNGGPGGIESLSIDSTLGLQLSFELTDRLGCIRMVRKTGVGLGEELIRPVSDRTETELVAQELEVLHRDALYEESLAMSVSLMMGKVT
jgi:glucose-6-phosphate dehydrogenase assembly protein OpcA